MSLRVFLCHAAEDKPTVRGICRDLQDMGVTPWLDEKDILAGEEWLEKIKTTIRSTHVVLVCVSRHSVSKEGTVQREIKLALDIAEEKPPGTIFIIPVRLEDCAVPRSLKHLHWIDYCGSDWRSKILKAFAARCASLGIPFTRHVSTPAPPSFSVLLDGSEFSAELASLAQDAGYLHVSDSGWRWLDSVERKYDLMIVVRGEEYSIRGNEDFYCRLIRFVENGGTVLATPWVSWETLDLSSAHGLLPFEHEKGDYFIDRTFEAHPLVSGHRGLWFPKEFRLRGSFERLSQRQESDTVLQATSIDLADAVSIPVLGVRRCGRGAFWYLNCCQMEELHPSPLESQELCKGLKQVFRFMRSGGPS